MIYTIRDILFSASLAVFVASSVFVAYVRWGHRCEPYARHMDYYYPAWKTVIACFLTNILMCPAVFMPAETDAVLQLRLMLILASPFFCAVLMFAYFGKSLGKSWWRRPVIALFIPFSILALTATVCALLPGPQLTGYFCQVLFSLAGLLALVYLACFFLAIRMIARALRRILRESYSNPEDFPTQYASRILWVPVVHVIISWVISFLGTSEALSIGLLALSVLNAVVLVSLLSPHRTMDVERLEEEEGAEAHPAPAPSDSPEDKSHAEEALSPERKDEIVRTIRRCVEEEKGYLDSHLTLAGLSRLCGVNRTYLSQVMSEKMGGFFVYVNRCRLAEAARLKVENPDASVESIAIASGFGTRQSYYNVRRQLEE